MSANSEFIVPVPTDGSQADATLREQRESLRDILASVADVVLTTDRARPLVPKLQQAAHSLAESEVRYRRLFETAQDAILILDGDTGQIVDANPFLRDLLGYSPEELLGKELWQIGLFQDIEASRAAFRQLQEKGYIRYEDLPLETKHGIRREVEFVSNVYEVGRQQVIQCNIRDITDRKQAEGALRQCLAELRSDAEDLNRFNRVAVGRELRMIKLKEEVNELYHRLGEPARYPLEFELEGQDTDG
jgi:PAS domain S-box-containing protein